MIRSKSDYLYYLECDKVALGITYARPRYKHDVIWKFERLLRKCEYIENTKRSAPPRLFWLLASKYYKWRYVVLSQKLGFSIGFNTCGPGLSIAHYGALTINQHARIGKDCRIHETVTIGATDGPDDVPVIGDRVFIGSGAKVLGRITVADGVSIGANAVVVKDITEPNITVGGVPARKISDNGSEKYVVRATEIVDGYAK